MSGGSKKKSGSKKSASTKGGANSNADESSNVKNPLIRPTTNHTINPRGILTGFYQKNGKRVQHIVHDGALQMPKDAVDVIENATTKLAAGSKRSAPDDYDLPGLDSVVRPCLDPELQQIVVTELVMEKLQIPQQQPAVPPVQPTLAMLYAGVPVQPAAPPVIKMIKVSRPKATNRTIRRIPLSSLKGQSDIAAERIRGGGETPTTEGQPQPQQQEDQTPVSMDVDPPPVAATVPPPQVAATIPPPQVAATVPPPQVAATVSLATPQTTQVTGHSTTAMNEGGAKETTNSVATTAESLQQKPATETKAVAEASTVLVATPNSNIGAKDNVPAISKETDVTENNTGPASTNQLAATDVKTGADSFTSPKPLTNDSNPQRDGSTLLGGSNQPTPAGGTRVSESVIPPAAGGAKPVEVSQKPSTSNEGILQQPPLSTEKPTVTTATVVPTETSLSDKKDVDNATKVEGNVLATDQSIVTTNKTDPPKNNETEPVSSAPSQVRPSVPGIVANTIEAGTTPIASISSPAVSDPSGTEKAVIKAPETTTAVPVVPSSTTEVKPAQTTTAVPVVSSSTTEVKPAQVKEEENKPVEEAKPAQVKEEEKKPVEEVPEAKALHSKPAPQWEQHKPGPNDETLTPSSQLPPRPEWYKKGVISNIERTMLPEWFDGSSSHRTAETYIETREKIIKMSEVLSNRNVTNAMIRRSIVGDAGSLQRLRSFLVNWGIINRDAINDSAPTTASLRPNLKRSAKITGELRESLILAVIEQTAKKRKLMLSPSSTTTSLSLNWDEIAQQVGFGVSAENCRENFMTATLGNEPTNAMGGAVDASIHSDSNPRDSEEKLIQNIVQNSNPEVLKKMLNTAIEATNFNPGEAQAASLLGLHVTQAVENARGHEIELGLRLSKLLDARMQKLENRMAMLDDVEGILEAEKVALEMERRDLYTARCRHWFGGV